MSSVQEIINAITYLQVKIPEELYRIKQDLGELYSMEDFSRLNNENKKLKKKNRQLKKEMAKMDRLISLLLKSNIPCVDTDDGCFEIKMPDVSENIKFELVETPRVITIHIPEVNPIEEHDRDVEFDANAVEVDEDVEEDVEEDVDVEEEEEIEVEEEEDAVYEVTIKDKTYYVINESDSIIYDADENGDICIEVGIYKKGKPTFYTVAR